MARKSKKSVKVAAPIVEQAPIKVIETQVTETEQPDLETPVEGEQGTATLMDIVIGNVRLPTAVKLTSNKQPVLKKTKEVVKVNDNVSTNETKTFDYDTHPFKYD